MKRKSKMIVAGYILAGVFALLGFSRSCHAQADVFALGGYGALYTPGEATKAAYMIGFDVPVMYDSASSYRSLIRTVYFQKAASSNEIQAVQIWSVHEVGLFSFKGVRFHIAGAFGFQNTFNDSGDDPISLGIKIEPGIKIKKRLGLSIGLDLIPGNSVGDQKYLYGLINFSRN